MVDMDASEKVKEVVENGHSIAEKIKNASSVSDIDALSEEIEKYCDFVNENFGIIDDFGEKTCELSFMLYMAAEEKARQIEYYPDKNEAGNEDILDFEKMLESKNWIKNSAE